MFFNMHKLMHKMKQVKISKITSMKKITKIVIVFTVISIFLLTYIARASDGNVHTEKTNLQVQSELFKPFYSGGDRAYTLQVRMETEIIRTLLMLNPEVPIQNIRALLNDWYSVMEDERNPPFSGSGPLLKIFSDGIPGNKENQSNGLYVEITRGKQKGHRFYIFSDNKATIKGDIAETIRDTIKSDADSFLIKKVRGRVHGLYIRIGNKRIIYVNRKDLGENLSDFYGFLGANVTIERAGKFIDGHETFHLLLDTLRLKGADLSEINREEEERLADLFGIAFSTEDYGHIPEDIIDELDLIEAFTGLNLTAIIKERKKGLEEILTSLNIDVQIICADTKEITAIKEQMEKASDINGDTEDYIFFTNAYDFFSEPGSIFRYESMLESGNNDVEAFAEACNRIYIFIENYPYQLKKRTVDIILNAFFYDYLGSSERKLIVEVSGVIAQERKDLIGVSEMHILLNMLIESSHEREVVARTFDILRYIVMENPLLADPPMAVVAKNFLKPDTPQPIIEKAIELIATISVKTPQLINAEMLGYVIYYLKNDSAEDEIFNTISLMLIHITGDNRPEVSAAVASLISTILEREGLSPAIYRNVITGLMSILQNRFYVFDKTLVVSLETFVRREGIDRQLYDSAVLCILQLLSNKPELIGESILDIINSELETQGGTVERYRYVLELILLVCEAKADILNKAVESSLGRFILKMNYDRELYAKAITALEAILEVRVDLGDSKTLDILESIFFRGDADFSLSVKAASSIGKIGKNKKEIFQQIYNIMCGLVKAEKQSTVNHILNSFLIIDRSFIDYLENYDWKIVLLSLHIDDDTLFFNMLFRSIVMAETEPERLKIAIEAKQALYIRHMLKEYGEELIAYKIREENLSDLRGIYKLEWNEFCLFMEHNYDSFHENPSAFNTPIGETIIDDAILAGIDFDGMEKQDCGEEIEVIDHYEAVRDTRSLAMTLYRSVENFLKGIPDEKRPAIDFEIDLALIEKQSIKHYAGMWASLISVYGKREDINFLFFSSEDNKEPGNRVSSVEFVALLKKELSGIPEDSDREGDRTGFLSRIKNGIPEGAEEHIRVSIWHKQRLMEMKRDNINLCANQYPVAMAGDSVTAEGFALRNFEAALAIGLCKAALVLAKREDKASGKDENLSLVISDVLQKMKAIYSQFILKQNFDMDEDTLRFMVSPYSRTRIDLAIDHALDPIERFSVEMLRERIGLIRLFLAAA